MSPIIPNFEHSAVVRGATEVVGAPHVRVNCLGQQGDRWRLIESEVTLDREPTVPKPHHHKKSAEMFYIIDGRMEVL